MEFPGVVCGKTPRLLQRLIEAGWGQQIPDEVDDQKRGLSMESTEELVRALEEHGQKHLGKPVTLLQGTRQNLGGLYWWYKKSGRALKHTDLPPGGAGAGFGPEEMYSAVFVLQSLGEGLRFSQESTTDGPPATRTYPLRTGSFILFPSGLWHESEPAVEDGRLVLSVMFGVSRGLPPHPPPSLSLYVSVCTNPNTCVCVCVAGALPEPVYHEASFLEHYPPGGKRTYTTLEEALRMAPLLGGVTLSGGLYELRAGRVPLPSADNEASWVVVRRTGYTRLV